MICLTNSNLEWLRTAADQIAEQLGIAALTINIVADDTASYVDSEDPTTIHLSEIQALMHGVSLIQIMAHEMKHVQQYATGQLQPLAEEGSSQFWWWRGGLAEMASDSPWELEAREFEMEYAGPFTQAADRLSPSQETSQSNYQPGH